MSLTSQSRARATPEAAAVLAKAVLSAAARLGLRHRHVAMILGTSEASVSRLQRGRGIDPTSKEGEVALLFLRMYRSLDAIMGGDDAQARAWLHAENSHVGGVPATRIRHIEGLMHVLRYLDAMRGRL